MEIKIMSVTDKGCERVARVRDYTEITDYRLDLDFAALGGTLFRDHPVRSASGLNADEVVEIAHEYGATVPYESLPTRDGETVEGDGWMVSVG